MRTFVSTLRDCFESSLRSAARVQHSALSVQSKSARSMQTSRALQVGSTAALLACALLGLPNKSAAAPCSGGSTSDKRACPQAMAAESPRGLALGTGVRAAALSTSAIAYSPAALALGKLYHIEGNVDYMADFKTVALGAAVVDSSTSKLGAGVAMRGFLSGNATGSYDGLDGRLGLGLALSDAFSLGLSGRYLSLSQDQRGTSGAAINREAVRGFTMDASLRVMPTTGFQIDVGALNFVDLSNPYAPVMLTSGMAISLGSEFSFGADLLTDLSTFGKPTFTVGGGLEYLAGNAVPLRVGYGVDIARNIHELGVGLGYTDKEIGFDIGLRQELSGRSATRIMAAFRYYVD